MNKKMNASLLAIVVLAALIYTVFVSSPNFKEATIGEPDKMLKKAQTLDTDLIQTREKKQVEQKQQETLEEKNRRLVIEKNERLQIGDKGPGEVLLSKSEQEFARKVVNDGVVENTLMLTPFDDMTSEKFEVLLDDFSNEESSQSAIENKSKYLNILYSAIDFGAPISLDRIECGEAICIASITYNNEEDIKGYGHLRQFLKKGGYDGKASAIIGENDDEFISQNKRGLVFTNGDGKGVLSVKHKWLK